MQDFQLINNLNMFADIKNKQQVYLKFVITEECTLL